MSDSAVTEAAPPATSSPAAKKSKAASAAPKRPRVSIYPPLSEMVDVAIKSLQERGGSSLQAIKKYITSNYKIDAERLSPFIEKYLKIAVNGGKMIHNKYKGASGSFKLRVKKAAAAKPRVKPSHPPTSNMVNAAIKSLKERGGSSLQAIKKYITSNYKIDAEKLSPFIKKYLKSAVTGGKLIQTKGKGASGSFKLSVTSKGKAEAAPKKAAAAKPKKAKAATGEKKPKAKKAVASPAKKKPVAKSAEKKKKAAPAKAAKKAASVKAPKAPKEKSTKPKAAAKKPKTPMPKKAAPAKNAAPQKAAAPKKK